MGDIPIEVTFGDSHLDMEFYASAWICNQVDWPWKIEDPERKGEELLKIWLPRWGLGALSTDQGEGKKVVVLRA